MPLVFSESFYAIPFTFRLQSDRALLFHRTARVLFRAVPQSNFGVVSMGGRNPPVIKGEAIIPSSLNYDQLMVAQGSRNSLVFRGVTYQAYLMSVGEGTQFLTPNETYILADLEFMIVS